MLKLSIPLNEFIEPQNIEEQSTRANKISRLGSFCFNLSLHKDQFKKMEGCIYHQKRLFPKYFTWNEYEK